MPTLETDRTELASLLPRLAHRLRNDALAIQGLAHTHFHASQTEREQLAWLAESLERTARLLDLVGGHLCRNCRFLELVERLSLEREATEAPSAPRPGGRRAGGGPRSAR